MQKSKPGIIVRTSIDHWFLSLCANDHIGSNTDSKQTKVNETMIILVVTRTDEQTKVNETMIILVVTQTDQG